MNQKSIGAWFNRHPMAVYAIIAALTVAFDTTALYVVLWSSIHPRTSGYAATVNAAITANVTSVCRSSLDATRLDVL